MKKGLVTLIAAGALGASAIFTQKVDAAAMRVKRTTYVYNAKAKQVSGKIVRKGQVVNTSGLKKIKGKYYWRIGKNQYVKKSNVAKANGKKDNKIYKPVATKETNINLDNHPAISAKNAVGNADTLPAGTKFTWEKDNTPEFKAGGNNTGTVKITYPDGSKDYVDVKYTYHGTNHIVLPADYTLEGLKQAESEPTEQMENAAEKGKYTNHFVSESTEDDKEKVKMTKLTDDQKQRISQFALKMINEARSQLGQPEWYYDTNTQNLADDVAAKYKKDGRGIQDGDHYVSGLVEVAAKYGYDLGGVNQIEDMYGTTEDTPTTMTQLKRLTYDGVIEFLFNGDEFAHAADIAGGHADEEWNSHTSSCPFAISFSRVDGWTSVHYIRIPSNL